jgi:hypothetical protein
MGTIIVSREVLDGVMQRFRAIVREELQAAMKPPVLAAPHMTSEELTERLKEWKPKIQVRDTSTEDRGEDMTEKYQAPIPPNTLRNADGTPYSAGYDEPSLGQVAYERLTGHPYFKRDLKALFGVFAPGNSVSWEQLPIQERQVWEDVAQAVKARL